MRSRRRRSSSDRRGLGGLDGRVRAVQSFEKAKPPARTSGRYANLDVARANVAAQRAKLDILARQFAT